MYYMDDKMYNNKKLTANEKLALNIIIKGRLRIKFIPMQRLGEEIHLSRQSAYKILESLEKKGYIIRTLVENRYFMTIITNKCIFDNCDDLYVNEPKLEKIKDDKTREIITKMMKEFEEHQAKDFADVKKAKNLIDRLYG